MHNWTSEAREKEWKGENYISIFGILGRGNKGRCCGRIMKHAQMKRKVHIKFWLEGLKAGDHWV